MLPILSLIIFLVSLIGFAVLLVLNTTRTGIITVILLMILTFLSIHRSTTIGDEMKNTDFCDLLTYAVLTACTIYTTIDLIIDGKSRKKGKQR